LPGFSVPGSTAKKAEERISSVSKISEELIYHGRILDLARETHRMPDQREARFEIIHHPGGAAALPILADGRVLLIRQFRPAARGYVLEIPAGRLESGEDGAGCVARELEEEIGYQAEVIEPLGFIYSSVGFCNERIHLFIARELQQTATAHEPDEYIEPLALNLDEALGKIKSGEITDAKTQICLLRYALERGVAA
jgi:ADP-ribose diphosphatase